MTYLVTLINHKAVCRTAPATPGLLNTENTKGRKLKILKMRNRGKLNTDTKSVKMLNTESSKFIRCLICKI